MKKTDQINKSIAFIKGMLASELGVKPEDVEMDITVSKAPERIITQLQAEGLEVKKYKGYDQKYVTIEDENLVLRINGHDKSLLYMIASGVNPKDVDREERIMEAQRNRYNHL